MIRIKVASAILFHLWLYFDDYHHRVSIEIDLFFFHHQI